MTALAVVVGCFFRERMPRLRASQFAQEFKTLALFVVPSQAPSISAQRWDPDYCCSCLKRILCVWWFSLLLAGVGRRLRVAQSNLFLGSNRWHSLVSPLDQLPLRFASAPTPSQDPRSSAQYERTSLAFSSGASGALPFPSQKEVIRAEPS
jgi:hypothetical protein